MITSNIVLFNLSLFGVFMSLFNSRLIKGLLSISIITFIGGMCYSIYLIHYAFLHGTIKITDVLYNSELSSVINYSIQFVINIIIVIVVAVVFYILIERPCMDKEWPMKLRSFLSKPFGIVAKR